MSTTYYQDGVSPTGSLTTTIPASGTASISVPLSSSVTQFWITPTNDPGLTGVWPTGTYSLQIDVATTGADLTINTGVIAFYRRDSGNTTTVDNPALAASWSSGSGTGLKSASQSWTPTASGSTTDRFRIAVQFTNASMMSAESQVLNIGEANAFVTAPWTSGAPPEVIPEVNMPIMTGG